VPQVARRGGLAPNLKDLADTGWGLLSTTLGLGAAIAVVDGATADGPLAVLATAIVVAVADLLLRPVLRVVAVVVGAIGAMLCGLAAQVLTAWGALALVPGVSTDGWRSAFAVVVVAALFMALGRWLLGANDSAYVLGDTLRRARARARRAQRGSTRARSANGSVTRVPRGEARGGTAGAAGQGEAGLLVVQLDGLSHGALRQAIDGGLTPTIARWLRQGTHRLVPWWVQVPSTTPASQAGLLHGTNHQVPGFRWWDKGLGRLLVTNRPPDAALVEQRISNADGLLAHDGVAIGTMFSGDAPTRLLVMSSAGRRGGLGPGPSFLRFFASPYILVRALSRSIAEMLKELYQGRVQRVRHVEPRVRRRGWYVVLRGITNALLRDLTVSLVAEHLLRGTPAIYVNLVDYDEIAHHAGPTRPESLRALEGLDRVLALLAQVAELAVRDYRIVVLSDHGQSLGATFRQVEGADLAEVCRALVSVPDVESVEAASGEAWGPVNTLLTSIFRAGPAQPPVVVGPDREREATAVDGLPELAVVASGNLGLLWFPRRSGRVTLEEMLDLWPRLIPGLVARPSVGVVVGLSEGRGPVAVGAAGVHLLRDASVEGDDPLAQYGPRARADLLRAASLDNAGDLLIVSSVDDTGQVHAFEELVGSHGGLGGGQNDAVLLHPAELDLDETLLDHVDGDVRVVGAEAVHRQLVAWMRLLGVRP
jgi:uncharacterized membrane protein YvlD (DUF360 family)